MKLKKKYLVQASFLLTVILIWQLKPGGFLPAPLEIGQAVIEQLKLESVRQNGLKTAYRVYLSSIIALIIGVVIGVADYFNQTVSDIINSLFYPTQFVSEAVLTLLAIAVLGLDPLVIYIVTVIAIVPDVFVATQVGLNNMDDQLLEIGDVYGESRFSAFRHLVVPQVIPYIFSGLIRTHATAWDIVATAEVFLASSGLGYMVQNQFRLLNLPELFALVVIIIAAGLVSDRVLRVLKTRVDRRYTHDQDRKLF